MPMLDKDSGIGRETSEADWSPCLLRRLETLVISRRSGPSEYESGLLGIAMGELMARTPRSRAWSSAFLLLDLRRGTFESLSRRFAWRVGGDNALK